MLGSRSRTHGIAFVRTRGHCLKFPIVQQLLNTGGRTANIAPSKVDLCRHAPRPIVRPPDVRRLVVPIHFRESASDFLDGALKQEEVAMRKRDNGGGADLWAQRSKAFPNREPAATRRLRVYGEDRGKTHRDITRKGP